MGHSKQDVSKSPDIVLPTCLEAQGHWILLLQHLWGEPLARDAADAADVNEHRVHVGTDDHIGRLEVHMRNSTLVQAGKRTDDLKGPASPQTVHVRFWRFQRHFQCAVWVILEEKPSEDGGTTTSTASPAEPRPRSRLVGISGCDSGNQLDDADVGAAEQLQVAQLLFQHIAIPSNTEGVLHLLVDVQGIIVSEEARKKDAPMELPLDFDLRAVPSRNAAGRIVSGIPHSARIFLRTGSEVADDGRVFALGVRLRLAGQPGALRVTVSRDDDFGNRVIQQVQLLKINASAEVLQVFPPLRSSPGCRAGVLVVLNGATEGNSEVPL